MHRQSAIGLVLSLLLSVGSAQAALVWSTAVDHNSTLTNQMRSVALAGDSVYVGYIQTSSTGRDVHRHSTASPYALQNNRGLSVAQPKGIATDDRGYVYVGNREGGGSYTAIINVHNADLSAVSSFNASTSEFGGVATYRSGDNYYLYVARESGGQIHRYDITDVNAIALDTSFGTGGVYTVPSLGKLRGLSVAADGTIFVTSRDDTVGSNAAGAVYRISADLGTVMSAFVPRAMDVALFGGKAYATSYNGASSLVRVLDMGDLSFVEDISIDVLDGNAYSRGSAEGFSGIDIGADGRIWLCDQAYATAKDRLLVSSPVPEPLTVSMLALGGLAVLRRRRS